MRLTREIFLEFSTKNGEFPLWQDKRVGNLKIDP